MTPRAHFDETLNQIRHDVLRMGGDAHDLVRLAAEAAVNGDSSAAAEVIAKDDLVDDAERSMLERTVITLMRESPVAADLRLLLGTIEVIGEVEKVADHAVKLARRARKLGHRIPAELRRPFAQLSEAARAQLAAALHLYGDYSEKRALAIVEGDRELDEAYARACNTIYGLIEANPSQAEHLVRVMECFHALEHVGDHAVAIAGHLEMLHRRYAV